jgi:hypothetical protein
VFGDYYGFGRDHDTKWGGQQGFWFRRVYFTFDYALGPKVTTRFRLEANSNGRLAGGSLSPYAKDLSLRWTYYGRQQMTVGLQPSLTFDHVENVWGLRHIEKAPLDLYKWDSSRDTGITFSGPLNASNTLQYSLQFGNESGTSAEIDRFKAIRVAARYDKTAGLTVEGMFARFNRDRNADRLTAQLFAAYRTRRGRVGFQYSQQERKAPVGSNAPAFRLNVVSGFGVYELKRAKASAFVRVDRYAKPCPECASIDYLPVEPGARFALMLAGIEYAVLSTLRFSPNIEWVHYAQPRTGAKPADDVVWRTTFYWTW